MHPPIIPDLADLDLSVRLFNLLMKRGIRTTEQLLDCTLYELGASKGLGEKQILDIQQALQIAGLELKQYTAQDKIEYCIKTKLFNREDMREYLELNP